MSRTQDKRTTAALAIIRAAHAAGERLTVTAVARACNIDRVTLHRAIARERNRVRVAK